MRIALGERMIRDLLENHARHQLFMESSPEVFHSPGQQVTPVLGVP